MGTLHLPLSRTHVEGGCMIARLWRGWTTLENADFYERLPRERVLPGLERIEGYRGGYVLRQNSKDEAEFVVLNLFESLDAVKAFAGEDYCSQRWNR